MEAGTVALTREWLPKRVGRVGESAENLVAGDARDLRRCCATEAKHRRVEYEWAQPMD